MSMKEPPSGKAKDKAGRDPHPQGTCQKCSMSVDVSQGRAHPHGLPESKGLANLCAGSNMLSTEAVEELDNEPVRGDVDSLRQR